MNESSHFEIQTATSLDLLVEWAAAEGWNPGLHDAPAFQAADPDGFLIGVLNGQPIGCISAVAYPGNFGFIGFYIVKPEFRGQGYGIQLWQAALNYLGDRVIGLDGVVDQQPNYRKSGFHLAYRNIRYQGEGTGVPIASSANGIHLASSVSSEALEAYDRRFFPSSRREFLQKWNSMPECQSIVFIDDSGKIQGWSVIRPCREGFKIGPLFADTPEIAETLFQAQCSFAGSGVPIFLDIPECNPAATEMVLRHGMEKVFETARMYLGKAPELDLSGLYGVTTFELG